VRVVVQRVKEACVTVHTEVVSSIGRGLLVLVGVADTDTDEKASWLARKVGGLRVFADARGKMSLSAIDVGGEYLVVSQFTLLGEVRHGLRPDFARAAAAPQAERLYGIFCDSLRLLGHSVRMGVFGANMEVRLVNDGPVTIYIDTDEVRAHGV
jgi:D-tyrosyl-tRNA(Tyr) deacylase